MALESESMNIASAIVGFISFSLTVLIWAHSFWDAFLSLISAPREVQDQLSVLRQVLYEEYNYMKQKRSRETSRSRKSDLYYDSGGPTKIIFTSVKDLVADFKHYEHPFLIVPEQHEGTEEKDLDWSFDVQKRYYRCGFWQRILWLKTKGAIQGIAVKLDWIQTRRIAIEVTEGRGLIGDVMGIVRGCEDRLTAVEERLQMSRVGWDEIGGRRT